MEVCCGIGEDQLRTERFGDSVDLNHSHRRFVHRDPTRTRLNPPLKASPKGVTTCDKLYGLGLDLCNPLRRAFASVRKGTYIVDESQTATAAGGAPSRV